MRKRLSCSSKGFTIIELLVVFSVISIIAGVGFATFSSYSDSQSLTDSIRKLQTLVEDGKNSALSGVIPKLTASGDVINCGGSVSEYRVGICETAINCNSSGVDYELVLVCGVNEEYVLKTGNFPSDVSYGQSSVSSCRSISFRSLTGEVVLDPAGNTCEVEIGNGNSTRNFTVDASGNLNEQ